MKTVKSENKNVYCCKTLQLSVTSKKYHSFNYTPFITQFALFSQTRQLVLCCIDNYSQISVNLLGR